MSNPKFISQVAPFSLVVNPEWSFSGTLGEMDNEAKGEGNSYTTEFRQYDSRIGRWLSLDPLMAQFPWQSPYCAFDNNPVYFTDPTGLKAEDWVKKEGSNKWEWDKDVKSPDAAKTKYGVNTEYAAVGTIIEGANIIGYDKVGSVQLLDNGRAKYFMEDVVVSGEASSKADKSFNFPTSSSLLGNPWNNVGIGNILKPNNSSFQLDSDSKGAQNGGGSLFGDILTGTEKHFNGGLGTAGVAVQGYNNIPNDVKRAYAYKLSKMTGIKSGKIFQGAKSFANSTGKVVSKLGPVGTVLGGGVITYEVMSGTWDAHTAVNAGWMIGAGVATFFAAPAVLTGIAIYGVGDYFFDFGGSIDRNVGRNSGVWGP